MIETKEQYEQAQFIGDRKFAHEMMDGKGLAWVVDAIFELRETIEALRNVTRAGHEWRELRGKLIYESEKKLGKALDALPDWMKE